MCRSGWVTDGRRRSRTQMMMAMMSRRYPCEKSVWVGEQWRWYNNLHFGVETICTRTANLQNNIQTDRERERENCWWCRWVDVCFVWCSLCYSPLLQIIIVLSVYTIHFKLICYNNSLTPSFVIMFCVWAHPHSHPRDVLSRCISSHCEHKNESCMFFYTFVAFVVLINKPESIKHFICFIC